jgi:hypothetical protein
MFAGAALILAQLLAQVRLLRGIYQGKHPARRPQFGLWLRLLDAEAGADVREHVRVLPHAG